MTLVPSFLSFFFCYFAAVTASDEPPSIEYGKSRSSSRWLTTPSGTQVAVDRGIEWQGVEVYLSLTWDLVAVDARSQRTLWAADVGAFWNRVGFAEIAVVPGTKEWCVELRPYRDTREGADLIEYRSLATGAKVDPFGSKQPEPGTVVATRHCTGPECASSVPQRVFVSTAQHWLTARHQLLPEAEPEDLVDADFGEEMILLSTLGTTWNCRGWVPVDVRVIDGTLRLRIERLTFQTDGGAVQHRPWGAIVLPRHEGPIVIEHDVQGLIGGPPLWEELERWQQRPAAGTELDGLNKSSKVRREI